MGIIPGPVVDAKDISVNILGQNVSGVRGGNRGDATVCRKYQALPPQFSFLSSFFFYFSHIHFCHSYVFCMCMLFELLSAYRICKYLHDFHCECKASSKVVVLFYPSNPFQNSIFIFEMILGWMMVPLHSGTVTGITNRQDLCCSDNWSSSGHGITEVLLDLLCRWHS